MPNNNIDSQGESVICYYELLKVTPEATDEDLRKAYRRLALLHHPDKNPGRIHEATQQFARIQAAYAVLSDPQERAWYDRNREKLLKRKTTQNSSNNSRGQVRRGPTVEDLMPLFGLTLQDDLKGVLSKAFTAIFEFEPETVTWPSPKLYNTSAEYPSAFYDSWLFFVTSRDDFLPYPFDDPSINRLHRRHLEREYNKNLEAARKEYGECVRRLVAFARKRDDRYRRWLEARQQHAKEEKKFIKTKGKTPSNNQSNGFVEQEWCKHLEPDEEALLEKLRQLDLSDSDKEEQKEATEEHKCDRELEVSYCVPCKKYFKSVKQWHNHERSRKHKEAIQNQIEDKVLEQNSSFEEADDTMETSFEEGGTIVSEHSFDPVNNSLSGEELEPESSVPVQNNPNEDYESSKQKPPKRRERTKNKTTNPLTSNNIKEKKSAKNKNSAPASSSSSFMIKCGKCKEPFASKNKLFAHLDATGHSQPL